MTHSASKCLFLNRPRRFGKSLLTSTLRSYFESCKELFEGLAIEKLEKEWVQYPVSHFDMSLGKHMEHDQLNRYLASKLANYEKIYGICDNQVDVNLHLTALVKSVFELTGKLDRRI